MPTVNIVSVICLLMDYRDAMCKVQPVSSGNLRRVRLFCALPYSAFCQLCHRLVSVMLYST